MEAFPRVLPSPYTLFSIYSFASNINSNANSEINDNNSPDTDADTDADTDTDKNLFIITINPIN